MTDIEGEQRSGRTPDFRRLRVMGLTATSREEGPHHIGLKPADRANPDVRQRIEAEKGILFHPAKNEKGAVAKKIGDIAAAYDSGEEKGPAVLVFVRTIEDIKTVERRFPRRENPSHDHEPNPSF